MSYGTNMRQWEHRNDESDWKRRLSTAIEQNNIDRYESLVEEGIYSDYDFPEIKDVTVLQLIDKYRRK